MPLIYAHYRFGCAMLPALPGDMRRTIQRFRRLYDVGLHGPDIFYYVSAPVKTKTGQLAIQYHEQTGREFFQRVCRLVRLERSEAMQAYLYGVLMHYCLDSACNGYLAHQGTVLGVPALRIETEFDRFLLQTDGKLPPITQDLTTHLKLTPGECETVAKFYPPATTAHIRNCLNQMTHTRKLLCVPEGTRRTLLEKTAQLLGPQWQAMVMTNGPDPVCSVLNEELLECYASAAQKLPELLRQMQAHLTYNAPFEEDYNPTFS